MGLSCSVGVFKEGNLSKGYGWGKECISEGEYQEEQYYKAGRVTSLVRNYIEEICKIIKFLFSLQTPVPFSEQII